MVHVGQAASFPQPWVASLAHQAVCPGMLAFHDPAAGRADPAVAFLEYECPDPFPSDPAGSFRVVLVGPLWVVPVAAFLAVHVGPFLLDPAGPFLVVPAGPFPVVPVGAFLLVLVGPFL